MERILSGEDGFDIMAQQPNIDCEDMILDKELMHRIVDLKFDHVLVDVFALAKCLLLIPHILDIPIIYVSGNPLPLAPPPAMATICSALPRTIPFKPSDEFSRTYIKLPQADCSAHIHGPWTAQ